MEICLLGLIQVHAAVCECYIDFLFSFFLFGLYFPHIGYLNWVKYLFSCLKHLYCNNNESSALLPIIVICIYTKCTFCFSVTCMYYV